MFVQFTFNTGPLHPRSKTKPGGSLWKCTRTIRGILTPSQVFNNRSLNITKCQLKHMSLFWILPVNGLSDLKLQDFRHLSIFQGGLAENLPADGSVGPLFACIIKKQVAVQIFNIYHSYLIFVISFTRAKFLENKIYTEKRLNYDKLHSKLRQITQ